MTIFQRSRGACTVAALLLSLSVLSGCDLLADDMCSEGEEPVYALDNPTGGTCISNGAMPPDGFATYPEQRVPQKVGDEFDRWPLAKDYPWADEVSKP